MRFRSNVRLHFATASLAVALASAGCAMMTPKAEHYATPPVGSTWTSTSHNTGSYGSETTHASSKVSERMWEGQRVALMQSAEGAVIVNPDGTNPATFTPNGELFMTYDPPIGYAFPLVVGKSWTSSHKITMHKTDKIIPLNVTWKIEAYEEVTVPAGTFKAFKISWSDGSGNETTRWFVPELGVNVKQILTRTAKSANGPGTREIEFDSLTIAK